MTVVTIATESPTYKEKAVALLRSLRTHAPELRRLVLTDDQQLSRTLAPLGLDREVRCVAGMSSRQFKTQLPSYVETEYGAYIDADAAVCRPIPWAELPEAPMSQTVCPLFPTLMENTTVGRNERRYTFAMLDPGSPQLNSGVMIWRQGDWADTLFGLWHSEWRRFEGRDQFAFHRALHIYEEQAGRQSTIGVLPPAWNSPELKADTVIHHQAQSVLDNPCPADDAQRK